jgi:Protein of unknown function (DUF4239)
MTLTLLLIPFWVIGPVIIAAVLLSIEIGYRIGVFFAQKKAIEKAAPVSVISGAILGLLSFLLAFTFGILYNRFDVRKELVRREANAIETVWLRMDFIPETAHAEHLQLLRQYVDGRLRLARSMDDSTVIRELKHSEQLQRELWRSAVFFAKEKNVPGGFLYVQAINEMIDIQNLRVARGFLASTPRALWISLLTLLALSMITIGYQTAVSGSRRTMATVFLTISFTLVFLMLSALEQPRYGFFHVNQQPLIVLREKLME